ncbi:MAG TPA: undecaprenyl-diphosphate phosphatase [Armatimonadota bacterium]|jgi:undecaprenyl-diphosphatase
MILWWQAAILGVIQGAGEFLPISSSAHLALAHWITGWDLGAADLPFDVALHAGTLLALLVYFGKDWVGILKRWREPMLRFVVLACIPGAIFGVLLESKAEGVFRDPLRIAGMLVLFGLVMAVAEAVSKRVRDLQAMNWKDALWIGLSQALAVMPGVSRSGVTITTGMFLGMTREAAARFSFLLSVPIVGGAALWEVHKLGAGGAAALGAGPLAAGILAAAIVGLACIHFLLRFLQHHTLYGFTAYRLLVAAAVVVAVLYRG